MASVNDYLKKLLYQYDCVVAPELGAFLTHYQPASFTESSGLFLPPRKRVAFNEALRLDDGILANYIMLHEPVTRDGAQRHINLFVSELRRQVAESGRFEIDGIGTFTVNDEGKLQFDPSLRHNFYGEAYGMSAISARSLTKQPIEALVVAPASTAVGPVLSQHEETVLMPMPRSRPYWRVAAVALLVGSMGLISYFTVIKPGQPLQSSPDPAMLLRVPATLLDKTTPAKEVDKPVQTTVTAITTEPAKVLPVEKVPAPVTVAPVPEIAKKAISVPKTVAMAEPVTVLSAAKPVRTTPYFTVIAGSFSSKRNALRLKRQLRKAGYMDAFVILPTRRGQLYKVAASGSDNRDEALAGVGSISKLAGTTAWIYTN